MNRKRQFQRRLLQNYARRSKQVTGVLTILCIVSFFSPMILGGFSLDPGKSYVSRFRFAAFDGKPDPEQLDVLWEAFANGKK